jgi:hypothetical protein
VDFKVVEVGDVETGDAEPAQGQQTNTATAAQTGDGDASVAQAGLLVLGDPAQIAREGDRIVKGK